MSDYHRKHLEECRRLARKNLDHQIITLEHYWGGGRYGQWRLTFPDQQLRAAWSILAVDFGRLVVHGDWTPVVFSGGNAPMAFGRLKWLGDTDDTSYYCAEKASLQGNFQVWVPSQDAFEADLKELIDDHPRLQELADDEPPCVESEYELVDAIGKLYEKDCDVDIAPRFGRELNPAIIYAHEAVRRCYELLVERHGVEGPRQCRVGRPRNTPETTPEVG